MQHTTLTSAENMFRTSLLKVRRRRA